TATTACASATSSCVAGTCVSSECTPASSAATANNDLCLGDLVCNNGICSDPNCTPGELACECNNGLCLGELVCENDVCVVGGDTDTDTTDTTDTDMECPNANEKMCDGQCVDVLSNNDNCGDCGVACKVFTTPSPDVGICEEGACMPTYSQCVAEDDGYVNCDQICALDGKACVEDGCSGYTTIQGSLAQCMSASNSTQKSAQACATNISWVGSYAACCCTQ
ncbi:MAG: hypothetical protein HC927_01495, partial [Deltaproteobacteria bacterium]|nr:hypothetical protein [Deltaproteobacteria bacterium]